MFFEHSLKNKKPTISQALGENMFSSALIALSLYQYNSALALLVSSFEAFLADIEDSPEKKIKTVQKIDGNFSSELFQIVRKTLDVTQKIMKIQLNY